MPQEVPVSALQRPPCVQAPTATSVQDAACQADTRSFVHESTGLLLEQQSDPPHKGGEVLCGQGDQAGEGAEDLEGILPYDDPA
eukprot:3663077-Amphidinium_carterae.1